MPKIKIITRDFESATCELPDGGITVGRDAQNAMVIADASVSRQHCELLVFGREVIVRDRASRNGTFVDEVRVQGQCGVNNGQIVRLGRIEMRVEIERPVEELTSLSAIDDFRKCRSQSRSGELGEGSFGVTFAPIRSE